MSPFVATCHPNHAVIVVSPLGGTNVFSWITDCFLLNQFFYNVPLGNALEMLHFKYVYYLSRILTSHGWHHGQSLGQPEGW